MLEFPDFLCFLLAMQAMLTAVDISLTEARGLHTPFAYVATSFLAFFHPVLLPASNELVFFPFKKPVLES